MSDKEEKEPPKLETSKSDAQESEESDHEFESAEEHEDDDDLDDEKADQKRRRAPKPDDDGSEQDEEEHKEDVYRSRDDLNELREEGDGEEADKSQVDKDEDKRNPQYIPKKGMFYEHDDRIDSEDEEAMKKAELEEAENKKKKKVWKSETIDRWGHDKFMEMEQTPKSKEELMEAYGYDIRNEDNAPRARRRRRYGRGPNKYTRDWKDEDAYAGGMSSRGEGRGRGRGQRPDGPPKKTKDEFPQLGSRHVEREEPSSHAPKHHKPKEQQRTAPLDKNNRPTQRGDRSERNERNSQMNNDHIDRGNRSGKFNKSNSSRVQQQQQQQQQQTKNNKEDRQQKNSNKKPTERKVDVITDDIIKVTIEDRKRDEDEEDRGDGGNGKHSKRYSSLRQPKHTSSPPTANAASNNDNNKKPQTFHERGKRNSNASPSPASGGNNIGEFPSKALAAAFPAGHYPNGPPNAAPFLNTQQSGGPAVTIPTAAPSAPAPAPYINPSGMVNYGPPPVQYTPVTVPISLPLVGVPDTFVPPGAVSAVPGGPLLPAHIAASVVSSPEQQVLLAAAAAAANTNTTGYAVERGGVTYFNPTAQAPVMQRAPVNKRPKAAIPIVDPRNDEKSLTRKESSDMSPQSSVEESDLGVKENQTPISAEN